MQWRTKGGGSKIRNIQGQNIKKPISTENINNNYVIFYLDTYTLFILYHILKTFNIQLYNNNE